MDDDEDIGRWLEQVSADRARQAWARQVPEMFVDLDLETLAALDAMTPVVVDALTAWSVDPSTNLVLAGPVGVGKTGAGLAAVRPSVMAGASFQFWPVTELLAALRPDGVAGISKVVAATGVLMIDDLGSERGTDWTDEQLFSIVNRRTIDQTPTIVTTNLEPKDLRAAVGERTYSRVVGGATVIRMTGNDRRRA